MELGSTLRVRKLRKIVCSLCDYSRELRPEEKVPDKCPACQGVGGKAWSQTSRKAESGGVVGVG